MALKLNMPAARLIAIAAIAGTLAGAIAVYVRSGGDGNTRDAAANDPAATACAAKTELAEAVGRAARGDVAALLPAIPPRLLTDLAFNDPAGKPITLADLGGRTLLLNLWATWCAPCRAEMPALDRLQQKMGGEDFEVVAVNVDTGDDAKPRAFLAETGVAALGYYRDSTLGLFNELKKRALALGLPVTLLIDRDGCLIAHMNGPAEWDSADAVRVIEAATGGRPSTEHR